MKSHRSLRPGGFFLCLEKTEGSRKREKLLKNCLLMQKQNEMFKMNVICRIALKYDKNKYIIIFKGERICNLLTGRNERKEEGK